MLNNRSCLNKIWERKTFDEQKILQLKQQFNISDLLAQILVNKNLNNNEIGNFLDAKLKYLLPDPFHLKDMKKSVDLIIFAIKQKLKICIFADYDVDGATSSALLKNFFIDIEYVADIYVPDRILEGYGPSILAMEKIKALNYDLVITVDCGASARDILVYAFEILKLQIIVIDHHLSIENFPDFIPIVNPNRLDETSKHKDIAAVGVTFLLSVGLLTKIKEDDYFSKLKLPNLMNFLDLVAIGTVCDIMPLTGLNRAFVTQGLKILNRRQNLGLNTLCDNSNITEPINCYHLGFLIGPRINAGGRVGKADYGAKLLTIRDDKSEAIKLANALNQFNKDRQIIETTILQEALKLAEAKQDDSLIFVVGYNWHPGVIGIVASRLKDKYNKPVAVIAVNNNIGKASCRSVKGINFGAKITEAKNMDLVINGGGHTMAAGFTVQESKIASLRNFLSEEFTKILSKLPKNNTKYYDATLTISSLGDELINILKILEPFGQGNFEPIFRIDNLYILKANIVGEKHINCLLVANRDTINSGSLRAIAFNSVDNIIGAVLLNSKALNISVLGILRINTWNNQQRWQMTIQDIIVNSN